MTKNRQGHDSSETWRDVYGGIAQPCSHQKCDSSGDVYLYRHRQFRKSLTCGYHSHDLFEVFLTCLLKKQKET